jgi:hypothetical protein
MIYGDHAEAAVDFELFSSEIESELFTGCGKGCGIRFS